MPIVVVLPAPGHGHIHIHLQHAHLDHNEGGLLNKMDPFVHLRVGDQEWTSKICEDGGKNPQWHHEHAKFDVPHLPHKMHIKVFNAHGGQQGVHIAEAEVPFAIFHENGPIETDVELHFNGHKAGHIHFKSEFHAH